jgi:hypothetical protein
MKTDKTNFKQKFKKFASKKMAKGGGVDTDFGIEITSNEESKRNKSLGTKSLKRISSILSKYKSKSPDYIDMMVANMNQSLTNKQIAQAYVHLKVYDKMKNTESVKRAIKSNKMAKGGRVEGREEHRGLKYMILYNPNKRAYSVKDSHGVFDGDNNYFETYDKAKEHAEISISSMMDSDEMATGGGVGDEIKDVSYVWRTTPTLVKVIKIKRTKKGGYSGLFFYPDTNRTKWERLDRGTGYNMFNDIGNMAKFDENKMSEGGEAGSMNRYDALVHFVTNNGEKMEKEYLGINASSEQEAESLARTKFNNEDADRYEASDIEYISIWDRGMAYKDGGSMYAKGGTVMDEAYEQWRLGGGKNPEDFDKWLTTNPIGKKYLEKIVAEIRMMKSKMEEGGEVGSMYAKGGGVGEIKKGVLYTIYDPGMNNWNELEYISYTPGYHTFREEVPMGGGTEITFTDEELKDYLKENLIKHAKTGSMYAKGGGVPIYEETDVEDLRFLIAENYDHNVKGDGNDVAKALNRYRRGSKAKYDSSTNKITYIIDYEEKMALGGPIDETFVDRVLDWIHYEANAEEVFNVIEDCKQADIQIPEDFEIESYLRKNQETFSIAVAEITNDFTAELASSYRGLSYDEEKTQAILWGITMAVNN